MVNFHLDTSSDCSKESRSATMSPRRKLEFKGEQDKFEGFMSDFKLHGVLKEWEDQVTVMMPVHMLDNGYDEDLNELPKKEKKKAKKCLKNHRKAMSEFDLAVVSNTITSLIEETKVLVKFPFGRLWLVLAGMY